MMPKQRGVKKLSGRQAGPYEIVPVDPNASNFGRVRFFQIKRHCTYEMGGGRFPSHRFVYGQRGDTFGDLMQAMRAIFRIEREAVAFVTGQSWQEVCLSSQDDCREVWRRLSYGATSRPKVQAMIEHLMKERDA